MAQFLLAINVGARRECDRYVPSAHTFVAFGSREMNPFTSQMMRL